MSAQSGSMQMKEFLLGGVLIVLGVDSFLGVGDFPDHIFFGKVPSKSTGCPRELLTLSVLIITFHRGCFQPLILKLL